MNEKMNHFEKKQADLLTMDYLKMIIEKNPKVRMNISMPVFNHYISDEIKSMIEKGDTYVSSMQITDYHITLTMEREKMIPIIKDYRLIDDLL